MNKLLTLIGIVGLVVFGACNSSGGSNGDMAILQGRIDSLQHKLDDVYKPGLGEFMSGIQVHHAKLWFAGSAGNWKLADFEIGEITEALEAVRAGLAEADRGKLIMACGTGKTFTGLRIAEDLAGAEDFFHVGNDEIRMRALEHTRDLMRERLRLIVSDCGIQRHIDLEALGAGSLGEAFEPEALKDLPHPEPDLEGGGVVRSAKGADQHLVGSSWWRKGCDQGGR